ncbi:MAG: FxsA family protein [Planctomycetota bacterium]|nr:FxsA family protein [Planctomycetota bacterium]MDA0919333.1 FxsA family protein [Planctomycetota bacterium]MDA1160895.1 FxsA family protein [Planctomycetota bacterium]
MFGRLLLLFILTPLIELWLLMLVSEHLGAATTIWLVLVTGFVGASLARRQGLQTWIAIQRETQQGKMPAASLVDAMMIFVAGLLLITPGMMTDVVGFSLLVPPVRAFLRKRFQDSIKFQAAASVQGFGTSFPGASPGAGDRQPSASANDVIDVEFHRHTED